MKASERRLKLKEDIRSCRECQLYKVGQGPVPFFGKPSPIMIVGEAPGSKEDDMGRPFVGIAGRQLWAELEKVGIHREEVLRANAVSCYPNRTPTDGEVYACRANLYNQVRYCDPYWILALGRIANFSLGNKGPISKIHGKWYEQRITYHPAHPIKVFPTWHPSAVLRDRTLTLAWREDLRAFAKRARAEAA